jgi:hypothetical protein
MARISQRLGGNLPVTFARAATDLSISPSLCSGSTTSLDKVRGYDADEFAGCDDLGLLPELWKMPLVTGDEVIGAGRVGTFQELVVVRILRNLERMCRANQLRTVLYELKKLLPKASADFEFGTREDFPVFRENGWGDIQPGGFRHRKHEHSALESVRLQSR